MMDTKVIETVDDITELLSVFYALLDWVETIPDSAGVLEGFGEVTTRAREALGKFEGYDAQTCTCGNWPTYKPGRHHRETCRMYRDASQS